MMIVVGTATALDLARRGGAPPGIDPLAFLAIPLGDMAVFSVLIATALCLRRKKEAHKRWTPPAFTAILAAAVARFPGVLPLGPLWFFGLTFLPILAFCITYDLVTRRRVHPAYLWGGALLILSVPVRLMISSTPTWHPGWQRCLWGSSRLLLSSFYTTLLEHLPHGWRKTRLHAI